MSVLPTIWGARLTYNFWRKDGYKLSTEDYRWVHVRRMFDYPRSRVLWHIFNFTFTAFLQNYLLLALVLPMWTVLSINKPFSLLDIAVAVLFVAFLFFETVADQQQWNFQTNKYSWIASKRVKKNLSKQEVDDFKRGFLIRGLFAYSRHPNFFAEISIWWTYYLFSVVAHLDFQSPFKSLLNYSAIGALVLTLLFHQSTALTERITKEKYPEYGRYQKHVSRIIPFFTTYNPK